MGTRGYGWIIAVVIIPNGYGNRIFQKKFARLRRAVLAWGNLPPRQDHLMVPRSSAEHREHDWPCRAPRKKG